MDEIDRLLTIIENRTRRRILESLMTAPSYPLQLSKELGVSQQAVMKNLTLMERSGLVSSYRESSSMGPERIVYVPNREFTLVIDMHGSMFSTKILAYKDSKDIYAGIDDAMERITAIDRELARLEEERRKLETLRNSIVSEALESLPEEMGNDDKEAIEKKLKSTTGRADPSEKSKTITMEV